MLVIGLVFNEKAIKFNIPDIRFWMPQKVYNTSYLCQKKACEAEADFIIMT